MAPLVRAEDEKSDELPAVVGRWGKEESGKRERRGWRCVWRGKWYGMTSYVRSGPLQDDHMARGDGAVLFGDIREVGSD